MVEVTSKFLNTSVMELANLLGTYSNYSIGDLALSAGKNGLAYMCYEWFLEPSDSKYLLYLSNHVLRLETVVSVYKE